MKKTDPAEGEVVQLGFEIGVDKLLIIGDNSIGD